MINPSTVGNGHRFGRAIPPLVVLLSQMALAAVIYRPTIQLAFLSDPWVYLWRLHESAWATLTTPTGYHYQPVGIAWIALIRAALGESATAFQVASVAQLALLSFSTFLLGRRLLPDAGTAFLGSLLLVGSAAFYEASYWPLAGNIFFLAAQLYVLAVILAHDVACGRLVRTGPWLLGLTALAAIFTHPAMITCLPVCALTLFLSGRDSADLTSAKVRAQKTKTLLALAAVTIPFVVSRIVFADSFALGPAPAVGPGQAYWLVTRGLVAVFSLRGSHAAVHGLTALGTGAEFGMTLMWIIILGWLASGVLAAAFCLWRTRTPGVRVLVGFLAIHVIIAAIAGGMSSRQSALPAVPAALLTAWGFRALAERMAAIAGTSGGLVCRQAPAIGVLLLITGAAYDHHTAADVHIEGSNLTRALIKQIRTIAPVGHPPVNLSLINLPGNLVVNGVYAHTFANGSFHLAQLASPSIATVHLHQISIPGVQGDFAYGSVPITPDALKLQLLEPSRVALLFRMPSGFEVLTAEALDALFPR